MQSADRQVLLELSQSVLFLERAGVNARRMTVSLPPVLPDNSRVVWCPRCPRGAPTSGRSSVIVRQPSAAARRATLAPSTLRPPTPSTAADSENIPVDGSKQCAKGSGAAAALLSCTPVPAPDSVTLTNRLPKWNEGACSPTRPRACAC